LHLLHISKTGGTAMKSVLRRSSAENYRVLLHPHGTTLADVPLGEQVTFVVRDPVARFVSGFNSRLRKGGLAHSHPWSPGEQATFERFSTANDLALALGSSDEHESAAARSAVQAITHLRRPQIAWIGNVETLRARQRDVLLVGRQWALDEDFARLAELIGLPVRVLPTDQAESHSTPPGLTTTLSQEAAAIVRRLYAEDYVLLAELAHLGPAVGFAGGLPEGL
jgi:hypothetical protein